MKSKKKNSFVIVFFKENRITLARCTKYKDGTLKINGFAKAEYESLSDRETVQAITKTALDKIAYSDEEIILLISHQKISTRYFKFPSTAAEEIEEIINLQRGEILPYPAEEIISGYQIVETEDGFSRVNVALVHRSVVDERIDILKESGLHNISAVYVSTYGLPQLCGEAVCAEGKEIIVLFLDFPFVEIAVMKNKKICLSRSFKVDKEKEGWQERLSKLILETQSFYLRQDNTGPIKNIVLIDTGVAIAGCKQFLDQMMVVPVQVSPLPDYSRVQKGADIDYYPYGIMDMFGFLLERPPSSLNLLPPDLKEKKQRAQQAKNAVMLITSFAVIVLLLLGAVLKYMSDKKRYVHRIGKEMEEIQAQARELETMTRSLRLLQSSHREFSDILNFFYAIHKAKPEGLFVTDIRFDARQNIQFLLKGLSSQIDSVFTYASNLKNLGIFSDEQIKVTYVTSKEKGGSESVDFEIVFLKKE